MASNWASLACSVHRVQARTSISLSHHCLPSHLPLRPRARQTEEVSKPDARGFSVISTSPDGACIVGPIRQRRVRTAIPVVSASRTRSQRRQCWKCRHCATEASTFLSSTVYRPPRSRFRYTPTAKTPPHPRLTQPATPSNGAGASSGAVRRLRSLPPRIFASLRLRRNRTRVLVVLVAGVTGLAPLPDARQSPQFDIARESAPTLGSRTTTPHRMQGLRKGQRYRCIRPGNAWKTIMQNCSFWAWTRCIKLRVAKMRG